MSPFEHGEVFVLDDGGEVKEVFVLVLPLELHTDILAQFLFFIIN